MTAKPGPRTLFVDDDDVLSAEGVRRVIHPGRKCLDNPLLEHETPIETNLECGGTVRKEGDRYRMWYGGYAVRGTTINLYAESDDGIHWTRPNLGLFKDFEGGKDNNIVLHRLAMRRGDINMPEGFKQDMNPSVMYTPHLGDGRTYTLISFDYGRSGYGPSQGYYIAFSPDGIHWTDGPHDPVIPGHDDVGYFTYDELTGTFRGMVKQFFEIRGSRRRCVLWTESDDALNWTLPKPVFFPDEQDDRWCEVNGNFNTQFYGMPICRYESRLLGFLQLYRCLNYKESYPSDGVTHLELVSSRDGHQWGRVGDRRPIVERGREGEFDWGLVQGGQSLVVDGDEVRLYYTGLDATHAGYRTTGGVNTRRIGMACWPRDRFVSLRAGTSAGEMIVNNAGGGELHLNADASQGEIFVALTGADGRAIPGFEADRCVPISTDCLDHPVRWKDNPSLPSEAAAVVLHLKNAEVFSLWWA